MSNLPEPSFDREIKMDYSDESLSPEEILRLREIAGIEPLSESTMRKFYPGVENFQEYRRLYLIGIKAKMSNENPNLTIDEYNEFISLETQTPEGRTVSGEAAYPYYYPGHPKDDPENPYKRDIKYKRYRRLYLIGHNPKMHEELIEENPLISEPTLNSMDSPFSLTEEEFQEFTEMGGVLAYLHFYPGNEGVYQQTFLKYRRLYLMAVNPDKMSHSPELTKEEFRRYLELLGEGSPRDPYITQRDLTPDAQILLNVLGAIHNQEDLFKPKE